MALDASSSSSRGADGRLPGRHGRRRRAADLARPSPACGPRSPSSSTAAATTAAEPALVVDAADAGTPGPRPAGSTGSAPGSPAGRSRHAGHRIHVARARRPPTRRGSTAPGTPAPRHRGLALVVRRLHDHRDDIARRERPRRGAGRTGRGPARGAGRRRRTRCRRLVALVNAERAAAGCDEVLGDAGLAAAAAAHSAVMAASGVLGLDGLDLAGAGACGGAGPARRAVRRRGLAGRPGRQRDPPRLLADGPRRRHGRRMVDGAPPPEPRAELRTFGDSTITVSLGPVTIRDRPLRGPSVHHGSRPRRSTLSRGPPPARRSRAAVAVGTAGLASASPWLRPADGSRASTSPDATSSRRHGDRAVRPAPAPTTPTATLRSAHTGADAGEDAGGVPRATAAAAVDSGHQPPTPRRPAPPLPPAGAAVAATAGRQPAGRRGAGARPGEPPSGRPPGCGPLAADGALAAVARAHSADMRDRGFFDRVRPRRPRPVRPRRRGPGLTARAENIARGQPDADRGA